MQLAQLNVALGKAALDDPAMAEFMGALDSVNALADAALGFVWRLQDEAGNATSFRAYDDERLIVNLSVWESIEALWEFVYAGRHLDVMRRRREWFQRLPESHLVLWWVPDGLRPTIPESIARLEHLQAHGPTVHAFTFKQRFEPALFA